MCQEENIFIRLKGKVKLRKTVSGTVAEIQI